MKAQYGHYAVLRGIKYGKILYALGIIDKKVLMFCYKMSKGTCKLRKSLV